MVRSLSTLERSNPPPRRKSCLACIRAKRRCDLGSPACERCRHRDIDCRYMSGQVVRGRDTTASPRVVASPAYTQPPLNVDMLDQLSHIPTPVTSSLDDHLPSFDILNSGDSLEQTGWDAFLLSPYNSDRPDELSTELTVEPPVAMVATKPEANSYAPRFKDIVKKRLQYAIDKIAAAPRQMVEESGMPWCHRHLYDEDLPRSMQDAISSAALYMAKNKVNSEVIHNCVESRMQDLLSSPVPSDPNHILARTHALLIYQTLRVFDVDIHARSSAEIMSSELEAAALALIPHIVFDKPAPDGRHKSTEMLPLFPLAQTREFWRAWIFQESARRTLLITFFFLQTLQTMRGVVQLYCDARLHLCHSFTLSACLWNADDAVDFAVAWRDRNHLVTTTDNIADVIQSTTSDDFDLFGKILITALLGIDEAKGWLAARGGIL